MKVWVLTRASKRSSYRKILDIFLTRDAGIKDVEDGLKDDFEEGEVEREDYPDAIEWTWEGDDQYYLLTEWEVKP